MRLLLIRHGQTPANVAGILDASHPGPGLTDLGAQQAAAIPDALRGEPIDAIFASTMIRTQLTAAPLAADRDFDVQVLDGLHEISAGSMQGNTDRDSIRTYHETVMAWRAGDVERAMPGGPDGAEFFHRFDRDIDIATAGAGTVAVFSHGAAIRTWATSRATNVDLEGMKRVELDNTGVVELTGSSTDGWLLVSWAGTPIGGAGLTDDSPDPTGEGDD